MCCSQNHWWSKLWSHTKIVENKMSVGNVQGNSMMIFTRSMKRISLLSTVLQILRCSLFLFSNHTFLHGYKDIYMVSKKLVQANNAVWKTSNCEQYNWRDFSFIFQGTWDCTKAKVDHISDQIVVCSFIQKRVKNGSIKYSPRQLMQKALAYFCKRASFACPLVFLFSFLSFFHLFCFCVLQVWILCGQFHSGTT